MCDLNKVFKNGTSKILLKTTFKKFTKSILEFFVLYDPQYASD